MSSLADLPELVGFFSYSREDDKDSLGALSALRERIQRELRSQLGRQPNTFRLWQDKEAISFGTLWEDRINAAVAESVFFIPVITPTAVRSRHCKFELDSFLAREAALGRTDLVFPIYYIEIEAFEDSVAQKNDPVLSVIAKRQYRDWREFRHRDINETDVKKAIEDFCKDIRGALNRPWVSPEEREKQEAEARERAAEDERQRQEAEAKRREAETEEARRRRERDAAAEREAEERLSKEGEEDQRRQPEEKHRRVKPRPAWPPSRRALASAGVLGVVVLGSAAVWFADTRRAPVSVETPAMQPPPAPVSPDPPVPAQAASAQSPAPPVQLAPGGDVPLSPDRERALKPKDTFKECDNCPEMVVVPAGAFTMGSPEGESGRYDNEGPQHAVTIGSPFAAGKFAVTFEQWDACVADGGCNGYKPSDQGWGRGWRPVINVSWNDATAYAAWLSRKTGKNYRLLSEAEREYVTRAGTTTPFWWGASISTQQANYDGTFTYSNGPKGEDRGRTLPVDLFGPNPWGLYQVHGNVWEWTQDCRHDSYTGAPSDGSAWITGDCSRRVLRGGAWSLDPRGLRAANRYWSTPVDRSYVVGFRLERTLTP
jgi:formylglycine-generating enzyme required for sulfatase activity